MHEQDYFNEIRNIIENTEVNKKVREYKNNYEDLMAKWHIGKLLVEAQGGEKRAKYGDNLIKKWSEIFSKEYGNGYSGRNMRDMRKFYQLFPIWRAVLAKLTWSHIVKLLPIKNENERNYYINQIILNSLSSRELINEIKDNAFDRLSYADKENIKLISNEDKSDLALSDMIKDPIIIKTDKDINNLNEKAIHKLLIEMLEQRFLQLGTGFTLAGHEYPLKINSKTYHTDLLFFNLEINAYVVVEVKNEEYKPSQIGQVKFYMDYIDKNIKKEHHSKTEGILIVKEKDKYVMKYINDKGIYITSFKLLNNIKEKI